MSLDRRMQFFMDQIFPVIWDRYQIPLELTYRSKPSDFKCRDISPELIELCGKAIWVKSKIVFHHWIQYMRKYYNTMVSSPKEFVTYVTYACNVMDYNTKDHYERLMTVCSLLAAFGANFFNNGNGEVIQYIPKILAVFFEWNMSSQFNTRGGWRRLDKYLLRQDYLNWHDETQIDTPDETREQKLARAVNFSKKVEMAIKATYSSDYNLDFITVKDIEDDLNTVKITEEVMKYFPEDIPSSLEEFQGVKKMKNKETDEACNEGETKKKIIENLVEFVKRSRSALGTDQQTKNDGISTQKLTEATNTQNVPEKIGKSDSSNVQVKTSTKRRKSKKNNKQDTSSNSKNNEFVPIKENLSLFCFSAPESEETSCKQTETAETSTGHTTLQDTRSNLDNSESSSKNRQTSKETNPRTTPEKAKDESASAIKRKKQKKKQYTSVPNIIHSVSEASDKQKSVNLEYSELLSRNEQNYKETKQITEIETLEKDSSSVPDASTIKQNIIKKHDASISRTTQPVEENDRQKDPVDLGCIQSFPENQQTEKIKQKKTESVTASENKLFSKESTEQKSNLKNLKSDPNNDQPIEDIKEIKSEILREKEQSSVQKFTGATNKETISKKAKRASVSNTQKVSKELNTYERAKTKSVSNKQQLTKETYEQTSNENLKSMESLPNRPDLPKEKLKETSEKTKKASPTSSTISKSTGFSSKKEAVAEIKSITESLAPKLEEFVVVLASLLWDLRIDVQT